MQQQQQDNIGKNAATANDDCPCWVSRLFHSLLLETEDLHVLSPLQTKYRNKITYNVPIQEFSPLAQDNIQAVCRWVNDHLSSMDPNTIGITELMVKATRKGELMVRFTIQHGDASLSASFLKALRNAFHGMIGVICWNYEPSPGVRPNSKLATLETDGDNTQLYLEETTPDGRHAYRLGPDTFSEVNPWVEAQQYEQTLEWINSHSTETNGRTAKEDTLLVSGRDISVFGLGYGESFPFVIAIQHCSLVHRDALYNLSVMNNQDSNKYTIIHCPDKSAMGNMLTDALQKSRNNNRIVGAVLTGGRKGLAPTYVDFLVRQQDIRFIVYNSCSIASLIRDMRGLLQGFCIQDARRYDFFPGTKYVASLVYLVRRSRYASLVLPVGPAGVGKSSLAQALVAMSGQPASSWWQRDQVYADLRQRGCSLAQTRKRVHQELLQFLRRQTDHEVFKILDSTNGNAEARALYLAESNADTVICVNFVTSDVAFLLKRTAYRLLDASSSFSDSNGNNHPSFPETTHDQRLKHESILRGIDYPTLHDGWVSAPPVHGSKGCRVVIITLNPETSSHDHRELAYQVLVAAHATQRALDALAIEGLAEVLVSQGVSDNDAT